MAKEEKGEMAIVKGNLHCDTGTLGEKGWEEGRGEK